MPTATSAVLPRVLALRDDLADCGVDCAGGRPDRLVGAAHKVLKQPDTGAGGSSDRTASAAGQSAHGAVDRTGDSTAAAATTAHHIGAHVVAAGGATRGTTVCTASITTGLAVRTAGVATSIGHFLNRASKKIFERVLFGVLTELLNSPSIGRRLVDAGVL